MLERRCLGEFPAKPHTVFKPAHKDGPASEFVFTRDGFGGGFSILYLDGAPTAIKGCQDFSGGVGRLTGESVPLDELLLMRRHVETWKAPAGKHLIDSRTALFRNATVRSSAVRGILSADYAFSNGDADELYFVTEGQGEFLTMFGRLPFRKNDYVLIPRGVPYVVKHGSECEMFLIEGHGGVEIPGEFRNPHGQLKLEAPYTHRDFKSPQDLLTTKESDVFSRMVVLMHGRLTEHHYSKSPAQVIGWDGSVYPLTFSIHDYLPKTGKIHLPPNLHMTFRSKRFVVCSFVPRLLDYGEGAIPCPYPHANVDCDEILYYVSGNFTSRRGIQSRSISFHPMGVPHGPQPGAYQGSVGVKSTDEMAVMLDTWDPLHMTRAALGLEEKNYPLSWQN